MEALRRAKAALVRNEPDVEVLVFQFGHYVYRVAGDGVERARAARVGDDLEWEPAPEDDPFIWRVMGRGHGRS